MTGTGRSSDRLQAAADYVRAATGVAVPASSERAFRGALRDGVLLCALANAAFPGAVHEVGAVTSPPTGA